MDMASSYFVMILIRGFDIRGYVSEVCIAFIQLMNLHNRRNLYEKADEVIKKSIL